MPTQFSDKDEFGGRVHNGVSKSAYDLAREGVNPDLSGVDAGLAHERSAPSTPYGAPAPGPRPTPSMPMPERHYTPQEKAEMERKSRVAKRRALYFLLCLVTVPVIALAVNFLASAPRRLSPAQSFEFYGFLTNAGPSPNSRDLARYFQPLFRSGAPVTPSMFPCTSPRGCVYPSSQTIEALRPFATAPDRYDTDICFLFMGLSGNRQSDRADLARDGATFTLSWEPGNPAQKVASSAICKVANPAVVTMRSWRNAALDALLYLALPLVAFVFLWRRISRLFRK